MKERSKFNLKESIGTGLLFGVSPLLVASFLTLLRKPEAKCCWGVAVPLEFLRLLFLVGLLEKRLKN